MLRKVLLASALIAAGSLPASAAESINWAGFHVGLNAGYGAGQFHHPVSGTYTDPNGTYYLNAKVDLSPAGFLGGGQIGYDHLLPGGWLVGAEADASLTDIQNKVNASISATGMGRVDVDANSKLEYVGTLRARLGHLVCDDMLVYATAGMAYGGVRSGAEISVTLPSPEVLTVSAAQSKIDVGWTVGAGTEYALSDRLTLRAEYLYADFGDRIIAQGPFTTADGTGNGIVKVGTTAHIGRVAFNYAL